MALAVSCLEVAYGEHVVLSDVSLELAQGERLCLLGPNAAGKTTLLRAILGLVPHKGAVRVDALPVGAVLEHPGVPRQAGSLDYLEFHARLQGGREARLRARELLMAWDVPDVQWKTLSLGQRQRLQIARSLVHFPHLLLLDEPSANLDPASRSDLWERLEAWRREGNSLLWTSHDLSEAMERADRIGVLSEGRLRWMGGAETLARDFPASLACRCEEFSEAHEACLRALAGTETVVTDEGGGALRFASPLPPAQLLRRLVEAGLPVSAFGPDGRSLFESYREALARPPLQFDAVAMSEALPQPGDVPSSAWGSLAAILRWELRQILREPRLFAPFLLLSALFLALQVATHASLAPAFFLLPTSICASLAADLVAGERERSGLDTLLATATPATVLLVGKALAVWLCGLLPGMTLLAISSALSADPLLGSLGLLVSGTLCATLLSVRLSAGAQTVRAAAQVAVLSALGFSLFFALLPLTPRFVPGTGMLLVVGLAMALPLALVASLPGAARRYRCR